MNEISDFEFKATKTISMEDAVRFVDDAIMRGEKLSEQLEEANKIIKHYAERNGYLKATDYLNKWEVK